MKNKMENLNKKYFNLFISELKEHPENFELTERYLTHKKSDISIYIHGGFFQYDYVQSAVSSTIEFTFIQKIIFAYYYIIYLITNLKQLREQNKIKELELYKHKKDYLDKVFFKFDNFKNKT